MHHTHWTERTSWFSARKEWAWRRMIDAVRGRDPLAAVRCLAGPPAVSADLVARLGREAMGRMRARVAGRPGGN